MRTVKDIEEVFTVSYDNLRVLRRGQSKYSVIRTSDLLDLLQNTEFIIAAPQPREKYERLMPVIEE